MKPTLIFLGLSLTATGTYAAASPAEDLTKRKGNGNDQASATVQFYWDTTCTQFSGDRIYIAANARNQDQLYGGPYGAQSAAYVGLGDQLNWNFVTDPARPKVIKHKPDAGECVSIPKDGNGIYATVDSIVNSKENGSGE